MWINNKLIYIYIQAAIFNSTSWAICILLLICASSYLHTRWDPDASLRGVHKDTGYQKGLTGVGWKLARIGERKSQYVAFLCAFFSFYVLFLS